MRIGPPQYQSARRRGVASTRPHQSSSREPRGSGSVVVDVVVGVDGRRRDGDRRMPRRRARRARRPCPTPLPCANPKRVAPERCGPGAMLGCMIILAATPIGNLGDASARLREALEAATVMASEDTRVTQRLLAGLGIDESAAAHRAARAQRAAEGAANSSSSRATTDLLVLSDAGMPTVSRPRVPARRRGRRGRRRGHRHPGPVGGRHGARRVGPADRPLRLRGVPAAQGAAIGARRSPSSRATADPAVLRGRRRGWRRVSPRSPRASGPRGRPRCAVS